jgi:cytochrome c-type biogenesis protein CcmH/NrfG
MTKRKKKRSTSRQRSRQTQKPAEERLSRREQRAQERKQKQRRQQLTIALVVIAAVAVVSTLIWLANRPLPLATVEARVPTGADGAAWGPADAPVVIQDWSDFG